MYEWLFSLPCHRSSAGLWFWQMIQIHLVFLTWARSAPPANAKRCCLPEKNKLFWRDVQKALWWLNCSPGWKQAWLRLKGASQWGENLLGLIFFLDCWCFVGEQATFAWRMSTTVPFITYDDHENFIFCAQWKIPLSIGVPFDIMWQMHPNGMPAPTFFFDFWHTTS